MVEENKAVEELIIDAERRKVEIDQEIALLRKVKKKLEKTQE